MLAILEYVAEKFPDARLWPADATARAHARAISTEMHAGFVPLRQRVRHELVATAGQARRSRTTRRRISRASRPIWTEARARFGAGGPFLFGKFSAADAMYAPVVSRFDTYAIDVSAPVNAYMDAMIALPAWQEWRRAALKETWVIPKFEYDWPDVKRLAADAA